jgi:hypothetical protein
MFATLFVKICYTFRQVNANAVLLAIKIFDHFSIVPKKIHCYALPLQTLIFVVYAHFTYC